MKFENFPKATIETPKQKSKILLFNNVPNNLLPGGLILALLATLGFLIWDKSNTKNQQQALTTLVATSENTKNHLQKELNDVSMQVDALKSSNLKMNDLLKTKYSEIEALKAKVQNILNSQNATAAQLAEARRLITRLKGNIETYTFEIEKLQGEKIQLTAQKRSIAEERDVIRKHFDSAKRVIKQKDDIIDIGSTLHASNLSIVGIKEKRNGKEKETTKAKRVDKLRISFDIDENKIAATGTKEIYVAIIAPDGTPVTVAELGSGKFHTRDGAEKPFTKKIQVDYRQGESQQVNVEWKQDKFQTGEYKIEIYNNGFKIGEGTRTLKKGGLFG